MKIVFDNLDEPDGAFDPCLCVENDLCKIGPEDDVYRCGHHCHEQIILDLCPDFLNSKCEPSNCDAGAIVVGVAKDDTRPKPVPVKPTPTLEPILPPQPNLTPTPPTNLEGDIEGFNFF